MKSRTVITGERLEQLEEVFHSAIECDPTERDVFVERACKGDRELLQQVRRLLDSHARSDQFIEPPASSAESALARTGVELPRGRRVGSFTVVRLIASGGAGTVYEAIQDHPHRTVALKVLRSGGGSERAMKRFDLELHFLARLRHAAIAQVFDAGTFEDKTGSVPYFAMEYVPDGKTIIDYAQTLGLSLRRRLELFVEVLHAVHHGHQRGIIHRDLKPANILVDAAGQPKVIDFGIARATDSDMALATTRTDVGQLVGTLPYMSPEQCAADPDEIDVRSDVYSAGVVFFELLCGQLPHDVRRKPITEAIRVIRDEAPTKPSAICPELPSDVETIALKSLQKECDQRYQSAADFADDIERFLNDKPIEARPTTLFYQLRLFARRNRTVVVALAAVTMMLTASVVLSTTYAFRANRAARGEADQRGKAERIAAFLQDTLVSASPQQDGGGASLLAMLEGATSRIRRELRDQPETEAGVRYAIGRTYNSLWLWEDANPHLQTALKINRRVHGDEDPSVAKCLRALTLTLASMEDPTGAQIARESLELHRKLYGEDALLTVDAMRDLAYALVRCSRPQHFDEAESMLSEALRRYRARFNEDSVEVARCKHLYAALRYFQDRFQEAAEIDAQILPVYRRHLGDDHMYVSECLDDYAMALQRLGRYRESEELLSRAIRLTPALVGGPRTEFSRLRRLAILKHANGDYDGAENAYRRLVQLYCEMLESSFPLVEDRFKNLSSIFSSRRPNVEVRSAYIDIFRSFPPNWENMLDRPLVASLMTNLGDLLLDLGEIEQAEVMLREALRFLSVAIRREQLPYDHWLRADLQSAVAACMVNRGRYETAQPFAVTAYRRVNEALGAKHWRTRLILERIVRLYEAWEKPDVAAIYRDKLESPDDEPVAPIIGTVDEKPVF